MPGIDKTAYRQAHTRVRNIYGIAFSAGMAASWRHRTAAAWLDWCICYRTPVARSRGCWTAHFPQWVGLPRFLPRPHAGVPLPDGPASRRDPAEGVEIPQYARRSRPGRGRAGTRRTSCKAVVRPPHPGPLPLRRGEGITRALLIAKTAMASVSTHSIGMHPAQRRGRERMIASAKLVQERAVSPDNWNPVTVDKSSARPSPNRVTIRKTKGENRYETHDRHTCLLRADRWIGSRRMRAVHCSI